jgi:hypothetical protein
MTNLVGADDLIRAGSTGRCGGCDRGRLRELLHNVFWLAVHLQRSWSLV